MEVEITIAIMGSIGSIGAALVSGTSMETGAFPLGVPPVVRHQAISQNPGGTPSGQHPYLLYHGVPALGNLWMRWTEKHPQGPTILLPRSVRLFYIAWNYGCSTTGVLWVCRVHFPQQLPFGRNEPLPTLGILILCSLYYQLKWEDLPTYPWMRQWGQLDLPI